MGDFQAARDEKDLESLACPAKYRALKDFHQYYSGAKVAPYLTIFIGGNHESSEYMHELPHGGWVAPNIYYMGFSSSVIFKGLRITGLSGIFKGYDYDKPHHEAPPYTDTSMRSVFHTRKQEVDKLCALADYPVHIGMSHDWPRGIEQHGDIKFLLRVKPHFRDDISQRRLGSPAAMEVLRALRPTYWLSAHLHVYYPALLEEEGSTTKFLALDKPIPHRKFMRVIEVDAIDDLDGLRYDPAWLAILHDFTRSGSIDRPEQDQVERIADTLLNDGKIPLDFHAHRLKFGQVHPNTQRILEAAGIDQAQAVANNDEIQLSDELDD